MWKVNKHQRSYLSGKPLSLDLRSSIIDKIVQRGGNSTTGHFPGRYVDVASELNWLYRKFGSSFAKRIH